MVKRELLAPIANPAEDIDWTSVVVKKYFCVLIYDKLYFLKQRQQSISKFHNAPLFQYLSPAF